MLTKEELASMIEHTNLRMNATDADIERLCQEALNYHFGAGCVRKDKVAVAYRLLKGTSVHIASVVGFPTQKTTTADEMIRELSQYSTKSKLIETQSAINDGAGMIDMVMDLANMKKGYFNLVEDDIAAVVREAENAAIVKVIIETCYLTRAEKILACKITENAGAKYAKTSTGYGIGGATIPDVELMSKILSIIMGIKAAGFIDKREFASQLYEASQKFNPHPFRVGASKLVEEYKK